MTECQSQWINMLVIVSQWMAIQRETSCINVANPCAYLWYCKLVNNDIQLSIQ